MRTANDIFHSGVHVNCILAYMYVYVEPQILLAQHWMNSYDCIHALLNMHSALIPSVMVYGIGLSYFCSTRVKWLGESESV